ncbi:hypothetical protein PIB30_002274 [Stylosanthes scabra]|uniref:Phytocyanin domain-containing protein n=1 Tax=Stylosanthes scabra TaxID=79078 RepID=A0ABU6U4S5_9FABA|nr:hypothetical protein [Stylosanthes scabra]
MATLFTTCSSLLLVSFIIVFCVPSTVNSTEFQVGGDDGWVVPTSKNDDQIYNQWASQNRFKVDDTLRFKYSKDSVMVVSEEEYDSCRSSKPLFFFNNGDTVFKLDHPGLFYFISGVSGHCDRGQKMIVKVLAIHDNPQPQPQPKLHSESPAPAPAPAPSLSHHHSQAARSIPLFTITNFPLLFLILPFAMFFV